MFEYNQGLSLYTWCLHVILLGSEVLRLYHGFFRGMGSLLNIPCRATLGIQSSTSGGNVVLLLAQESLFIPNFVTRGIGWLERISCSSLDCR